MKRIESWDEYFMNLVRMTAMRSPDPSTKTGAVIVSQEGVILSTGYNGLPRSVEHKPEFFERPLKYKYIEHAERNAIYNATRSGAILKGAKMYASFMSCAECMRAIIQCGITEYIFDAAGQAEMVYSGRWDETEEISPHMAAMAGVKVTQYRLGDPIVSAFLNGKTV